MVSGRMYSAPSNRKLNFKQVKQVQKIVESNKQLKRVDQVNNSSFNTTGDLHEITVVAKGDENFERDTDRINLLKVELTHIYYLASATGTTPLFFRVMFVRSKRGPLVLADFPAYGGTADYDKMQVYHDSIHQLEPFSTVATQTYIGNMSKRLRIIKSFKKKNIPHLNVGYDTDVSVTLAQVNPLYYYVIGNVATSITQAGITKIAWYDKD